MIGYYQAKNCGSIYHVYKQGSQLYAHCLKSSVRTENNPFPVSEINIDRYIKWKSWVMIEKPDL